MTYASLWQADSRSISTNTRLEFRVQCEDSMGSEQAIRTLVTFPLTDRPTRERLHQYRGSQGGKQTNRRLSKNGCNRTSVRLAAEQH